VPRIPAIARRVPAKWYAAIVGTIGLVVSAFYGGLSPVSHSSVDKGRVDAVIKGGPWNVTVIDARILKSSKDLEVTKPGDRWLVVVATVDVTSDDSRDDLSDAIRLHDVFGLQSAAPNRLLLARDGTDVSYLNPGMPERVGFAWEQAPTAGPLPATVEVNIYGETLRHDSLSGGIVPGNLGWFDRRVIARVAAPVLDKRT